MQLKQADSVFQVMPDVIKTNSNKAEEQTQDNVNRLKAELVINTTNIMGRSGNRCLQRVRLRNGVPYRNFSEEHANKRTAWISWFPNWPARSNLSPRRWASACWSAWSASVASPEPAAGLRTFALVALLGCLFALLGEHLETHWAFAAGLLAITGWFLKWYKMQTIAYQQRLAGGSCGGYWWEMRSVYLMNTTQASFLLCSIRYESTACFWARSMRMCQTVHGQMMVHRH